MTNQNDMVRLKTNTSELFDLFHFVQKMDSDVPFEQIADIGYVMLRLFAMEFHFLKRPL